MNTSYRGLIASLALLFMATTLASAQAEESLAKYFEYDPILTEPMQQDEVEPAPAQIMGQDSLTAEFCEKCCFDGGCGSDCCGSTCCDSGCCGYCNSCGCCDTHGCVLPELLLGCFCPTPCCFDDWISPMTNPVFFEDPRTLTELRGIFIQHKVPQTALGGDIQLYALQIRAALSDRLSLIATKDGYAVSTNPLIADGWADLSLGLKYNLYRDCCTESLLTGGVVYKIPVGSHRTQQGLGDGLFHVFLSGGTELCCDWHYLSSLGFRLPVDDNAETTSMYWSNHLDYHLGHGFYALGECNWYHWLESGTNGVPGISGGDLFNLGSTGVAGNNIVSGAFGVKYKPNRLMELGVAWEVPLTERRDVLENRLTVDLILRY